jgi:hypothetical protein
MYFPHMATGAELQGLQEYHELPVHATPKGDGTYNYNVPSYREIPKMDNVKFVGYWQSFKYFDWCRNYILEKFNLPWHDQYGSEFKFIGIHVRRGDFLQLSDKHPSISINYYIKAIEHFRKLGYLNFKVFSDDIPWCMEEFSKIPEFDLKFHIEFSNFSDKVIGATSTSRELLDLQTLANADHQILCYSTFGFIAAYLNRNPDKQVILPPIRYNFGGANQDFIPDTFTQLDF